MTTIRAFQHQLRRNAAAGIFHVLDRCANLAPAAPNRGATGRRAIIIPPGAAGSLGDEAMFQGLRSLLERSGFEEITVASLGRPLEAGYLERGSSPVRMRSVVLRGYTRQLVEFAALARSHSHCFVIGADVMDGFYSLHVTRSRCQLASIAAHLGLETAITGFSLRDDVPAACVRALRETDRRVRLLMRDAVSLERARRHGLRGELVADLAFLLQPDPTTVCAKETRAWAERERAEGRIVLGVNANYLLVEKIAASAEECVAVYADLLARLSVLHPKLSLLLIPHDLRSAQHKVSDLDLCRMISARLPATQHSYVVDGCRSAAEIKEIVTCADLIFTGRMHLAIASLGRAVPAVAVAYQGKFEGFYRHFGLSGMQLPPDELKATESAAQFLSAQINQRTELAQKIAGALPSVLELSRRNLAGISK